MESSYEIAKAGIPPFVHHTFCPNCQKIVSIAITDIGRKLLCPHCKSPLKTEPEGAIFSRLNVKQKQAVSTVEGIIRLVAGAGTGKTRVLVHRLAHLISNVGIPQDEILSVTFTNKAANVMKKRAMALLNPPDGAGKKPGVGDISTRICTFHGFCYEMLKEDIHYVGFPKSFDVMDENVQHQVIAEILKERKISVRDYPVKKVAEDVCIFKSKYRNYVPYLFSMDEKPFLGEDAASVCSDAIKVNVFNDYLKKQRNYFRLDFDDLILFAVHILQTYPECKKKWNKRIRYIQVDEFQDVDGVQFELLGLLIGSNNNLFVVGDPDQNIYSWRGARQEYIMGMANFAAVRNAPFLDLVLDENYRSYQRILDVSNNMIAHNTARIKKSLVGVRGQGGRLPYFYHAKNNTGEATWIADTIQMLKEKDDRPYSDFAVLLRSIYTSRILEQVFRKSEIPYVIVNGVAFYQRKEVHDALSYLRLLVMDDDLAFLRIINSPARGIGDAKIKALKAYTGAHPCSLLTALKNNLHEKTFNARGREKSGEFNGKVCTYKPLSAAEFVSMIMDLRGKVGSTSVSQLLIDILDKSGYKASLLVDGEEERLANLKELIDSVKAREQESRGHLDVQEYLNELAMYSEKSGVDGETSVKMMTIHVAKGMEFPYVFVPFLNESILPSVRAVTPAAIEEERRVAYVALTRAENMLFLSESDGYNAMEQLTPSRFLIEMKPECLDCPKNLPRDFWTRQIACWGGGTATADSAQSAPIRPGMKVRSEYFGVGFVEKIDDNIAYVRLLSDNEVRRLAIHSLRPAAETENTPARQPKATVQDFADLFKKN